MKDKPMLVVIIVTFCILIITIISQIKKSERCDEHVLMEDGTEYDCKSVSSFNSGVSTINLCDGERITVPTDRIKIITEIKE